jgi:hypothetical protein
MNLIKKNKKYFVVIADGESKGLFNSMDQANKRYEIWKNIFDKRSDYNHVSGKPMDREIQRLDRYQNEAGFIKKILIQEMYLNA